MSEQSPKRDILDYFQLGLEAQQSFELHNIRTQLEGIQSGLGNALFNQINREELENNLKNLCYNAKNQLAIVGKDYSNYPVVQYIASKTVLNNFMGLSTNNFRQIVDKEFFDAFINYAKEMQNNSASELGASKDAIDKFLGCIEILPALEFYIRIFQPYMEVLKIDAEVSKIVPGFWEANKTRVAELKRRRELVLSEIPPDDIDNFDAAIEDPDKIRRAYKGKLGINSLEEANKLLDKINRLFNEIKAIFEFPAEDSLEKIGSNSQRKVSFDLVEFLEPPSNIDGFDSGQDALFEKALHIVMETQRGSVSLLQQRLNIDYNRATRLVKMMAEIGIVDEYESGDNREVLMTLQEWNKEQVGLE